MKRRSHCQPEVQLVVQLMLSWSCRRVVCALALLRLELRISTAGDDVCTPPIGAVALLRDQGCPPRRLWLIARRPTVSRSLHLLLSTVLSYKACPVLQCLSYRLHLSVHVSACPSVPQLSPTHSSSYSALTGCVPLEGALCKSRDLVVALLPKSSVINSPLCCRFRLWRSAALGGTPALAVTCSDPQVRQPPKSLQRPHHIIPLCKSIRRLFLDHCTRPWLTGVERQPRCRSL